MRVAITGSSGLIGTALRGALEGAGHEPVPVVRRAPGDHEVGWDPDGGTIDATGLEGVDAVVNLAGAGIGDKRWTEERKRLILESRTRSTALLASALARLARPPAVLVSASGVDYYGDRGDEVLTEGSSRGASFLADLCAEWEATTVPAADAGIRTTFLRTGMVLSRHGGALARMLLPFRLGLGGRLGSGAQWMSWITIDDAIMAIMHLLDHDVSGPHNLTAPNPVRNADFTRALGRELGRPTLLPTPVFALRAVFGSELIDSLMLESKRVEPAALVESGFRFRHETIEDGLAAVLGDEEMG